MNTRKVIRRIERALAGDQPIRLSEVVHVRRAIVESIASFIAGRPL